MKISDIAKLEEAFDTNVEWVSEPGPGGSTVYAAKIDDAYIEITYKPMNNGVYISFTRGGRMSVTGEGSQNKIFGAVINHIRQWAAKNNPAQIVFSAFKPRTGAFGSQDTSRSGLYQKMVQRFASQNGYEYDVEDTGNEDTFILTKNIAENFADNIPKMNMDDVHTPVIKRKKTGEKYISHIDGPNGEFLVLHDNGKYMELSSRNKAYLKKEFGLEENFADGKKPGRKGLAKRSGVNTKASVSSLRKTAKNSSGEKQRMAHWLANMKAGRQKAKKK